MTTCAGYTHACLPDASNLQVDASQIDLHILQINHTTISITHHTVFTAKSQVRSATYSRLRYQSGYCIWWKGELRQQCSWVVKQEWIYRADAQRRVVHHERA
jgi:hypothetical protein